MKRYTVTLVEQVYYECEVEAVSEFEANLNARQAFRDKDEYQHPSSPTTFVDLDESDVLTVSVIEA